MVTKKELQISIEEYSNGIYFIQFINGIGEMNTSKIMKY